MENPSEPIIFLEGVNIANDDGVVIRDLSLSVERGGFIYIVGKVGSGKSTIIKSLIAEWPIKSGIARVGDFNLVKMKRRMKKQKSYIKRKIFFVEYLLVLL